MRNAARIVTPELLDGMAPDDPRARRARRDLRRVHRAMGTVSILQGALGRLRMAAPPRRILELGAGDGHLLLRLARALTPRWHDVELTLIDLHDLVSAETRHGYRALGWKVEVSRGDVLDWAASGGPRQFDLSIACLFLHHFSFDELALLMRSIAARSSAFIACEPRRGVLARMGSELIGILGTNRVTREDAVTSVKAGFDDNELSALWPRGAGAWSIEEYPAFPFSHCFTAVLSSARR
jgi:SAM-dependent methyltransferase